MLSNSTLTAQSNQTLTNLPGSVSRSVSQSGSSNSAQHVTFLHHAAPGQAQREGSGGDSGELKYVVKRRKDGSEYIARRPVREKVLRERERRIVEERGLTTDDDAASEWKMGRYWNRGDRKKHLARARDQKKHREAIREQKAEQHRTRVDEPIMELAHRKQLRVSQRQGLCDDFITTKELLAHGVRAGKGGPGGVLLSVTTV